MLKFIFIFYKKFVTCSFVKIANNPTFISLSLSIRSLEICSFNFLTISFGLSLFFNQSGKWNEKILIVTIRRNLWLNYFRILFLWIEIEQISFFFQFIQHFEPNHWWYLLYLAQNIFSKILKISNFFNPTIINQYFVILSLGAYFLQNCNKINYGSLYISKIKKTKCIMIMIYSSYYHHPHYSPYNSK